MDRKKVKRGFPHQQKKGLTSSTRGEARRCPRVIQMLFTYKTCMRRAPARHVLALYIYIVCAWPRCNATPSDTLHSKGRTSLSTLYTSYFTLYTSFHLISSKLISSLRKCHLSFSQFPSSHLSNAQALSVYTQKLWHTARFYTQQTFTHKSFYWVSFYMWTPLHHRETFRHIIFYTQVFTHSKRL